MPMLRVIFTAAVFVCLASADCIPVATSRIMAGNLATVDPVFSRINPSVFFSFAPPLGSQRAVSASLIEEFAVSHGIEGTRAHDVCFERISHLLGASEVREAVERSFKSTVQHLDISVIEVCKCQVPVGRVDFPLSGFSTPSSQHPQEPVLWRGRVTDEDGRAYPVWARLKVLAAVNGVRATRDLRAQQILTKDDLEEVAVTAFPTLPGPGSSLAHYEGKMLKVSISRGSYLQPNVVFSPSQIVRGSLVQVEVKTGAAKVETEARAESSGNTGDTITLTNLRGAARFHATVVGSGRAEIVLPSPTSAGSGSALSTAALPNGTERNALK